MDKLGVVTEDTSEKTASKGRSCPKCGGSLPELGGSANPNWCPKCGTEPFEKKPTK